MWLISFKIQILLEFFRFDDIWKTRKYLPSIASTTNNIYLSYTLAWNASKYMKIKAPDQMQFFVIPRIFVVWWKFTIFKLTTYCWCQLYDVIFWLNFTTWLKLMSILGPRRCNNNILPGNLQNWYWFWQKFTNFHAANFWQAH